MPIGRSLSGPHPASAGKLATARRWASAARSTPIGVTLLVPSCCMLLAAADVAIATVPLRRLTTWLGTPMGSSATAPTTSPRQARRAARIARAIAIAARLAPFRSDCYPQALVAVVLGTMFRLPTAIHFGAKLHAAEAASARHIEGHVWTVSGDVCLSGGADSFARFPTLACFVRQNGRPG